MPSQNNGQRVLLFKATAADTSRTAQLDFEYSIQNVRSLYYSLTTGATLEVYAVWNSPIFVDAQGNPTDITGLPEAPYEALLTTLNVVGTKSVYTINGNYPAIRVVKKGASGEATVILAG